MKNSDLHVPRVDGIHQGHLNFPFLCVFILFYLDPNHDFIKYRDCDVVDSDCVVFDIELHIPFEQHQSLNTKSRETS